MPVYDYTYKTWEGERRGPFYRWLAIPKFAYMEFFKRRMFVWLFTMAWAQFLLRMIYMYILINLEFLERFDFGVEALPKVDAAFFKSMIDMQLPFCFAFCFMLGSGLISRDMRNGALVLYASKPISRWEYFFGKFSILFALILSITVLQVLILFVLQFFASPADSPWHTDFWEEYASIPLSAALYSLVISAGLSLLILAASSLTKSGRYAAMTFAVYIIGTSAAAGFLTAIVRNDLLWVISPLAIGQQIGSYLFVEDLVLLSRKAVAFGLAGNLGLAGLILYWNISRAARTGR